MAYRSESRPLAIKETNWIGGLFFAVAMVLAGSDGDWFPWVNLAGLFLFLTYLLFANTSFLLPNRRSSSYPSIDRHKPFVFSQIAPGAEAPHNIGQASSSSFHPATPDGISSGPIFGTCKQGFLSAGVNRMEELICFTAYSMLVGVILLLFKKIERGVKNGLF